jgi:hypothetical protein
MVKLNCEHSDDAEATKDILYVSEAIINIVKNSICLKN